MEEPCFASSYSFSRYYEQDLALAKDLQDKLAQAKAYCNLGLAHKALGEYSRAEECQRYLLSLAQALDNTQVTHTHTRCCAHSVLGIFFAQGRGHSAR